MSVKNDKQGAQEDLLNFDWATEDEDSFFGIPEEIVPDADKVQEIDDVDEELKKDEDASEEETKKDDEVEKKEEPAVFFDVDEGSEEDDEEETKTISSSSDPSLFLDLYKDLKESGVFKHVELEEGVKDMSVDDFLELQRKEYEEEIKDRLVNWANEELDSDAKAFIKYKIDGGDTHDFFDTIKNYTDVGDGNIDDEEYQDKVIIHQLQTEGWSEEEIEERLEYLTDTNRKKSTAKRYNKKIIKDREAREQEMLEQAAENKKQAKEQEKVYKNEIKGVLDSASDIKGFKISKNEKNELFNLLTKKDYETKDGKQVTGFQKKFIDAVNDKEKLILLAKLLNSDFDMSGFEKKVKTEVTKKYRTNLEQRKSLRPSGSGSSSQGVHIAEFFN